LVRDLGGCGYRYPIAAAARRGDQDPAVEQFPYRIGARAGKSELVIAIGVGGGSGIARLQPSGAGQVQVEGYSASLGSPESRTPLVLVSWKTVPQLRFELEVNNLA
jgi:hypothetical protein